MKRLSFVAVLAILLAPGLAAAQEATPPVKKPAKTQKPAHPNKPLELKRTLFSGSESLFSEFGWARNDCTTTIADVRTITAPSHGEFRIEQVINPGGLNDKNYQERCKGRPSSVSRLYYKASAAFTGQDRFVIEVDNKLGHVQRATYLVTISKNGKTDAVGTGDRDEVRSSSVLSGNETRLAAPNYVNTDCTSGALPDVRIATAPQHGNVRMEPIIIPVERPPTVPASKCNGKPVDAVGVFYKPTGDFKGEDLVAVDVDFKRGSVRRLTYKITVR